MRIFLDTNIYIVGAAEVESDEYRILEWLGFWQPVQNDVEVIISQELLDQISRVAKRLRNKDWSGELIGLVWRNLNTHYVILEEQALSVLKREAVIPREDIGVYLTAQAGKADYFLSANHKLIRSAVEVTREFDCLTPNEFVKQHL